MASRGTAIRNAQTLSAPPRASRRPRAAPRACRRPRCSLSVAQAAATPALLDSAPPGNCGAGLAQYPLQADSGAGRARASAWLEPAVQEAVRHIASSSSSSSSSTGGRHADPFLLIVRARDGSAPYAPVPLTPAALEGGWEALSRDLGGDGAEGVLLVQPVPSSEALPGGSCFASSSGGECKECAAAASESPQEDSGAAAVASDVPNPVTRGSVGACCDGEQGQGPAAAAPPPGGCQVHAGSVSSCYGVVVLRGSSGGSGDSSGPEGCYLLKTTHLANPVLGCTCSQYCLTRVAKGPSLKEQLTRSWLV